MEGELLAGDYFEFSASLLNLTIIDSYCVLRNWNGSG